ncbi:PREDICTED: semaphorin-2A-like [Priapulus caudatus]|uniref:Semaphorin-2A-like n=1 Tax=Priapulus caudatus TaxID=37621 RepID=A0ABM1DSA1_PRICU|nr:PREDICTED: semaphorin-2A-like [Priapulus caudatus]
MSTDNGVYQMSVHQCERYSLCADCVQDPYCGYDRATMSCKSYKPFSRTDNLLQSVMNAESQVCELEILNAQQMKAVPGQTVYLRCDVPTKLNPLDDARYAVSWYHQGEPVKYDDDRLLTVDSGLVLVNVDGVQTGEYKCMMRQQTLSKYEIVIDSGELSSR